MSPREQQRRWAYLKAAVRNAELIMEANGIRADMARTAIDFGKKYSVSLPHNPDIFQKQDILRKGINRIKKLIDAAESEKLGVRFTKQDIDIMALPEMTDDEIAEYHNLGFVFVLVGVAIIVGAVGYAYMVDGENKNLRTDFNQLLNTYDLHYCADPTSDMCKNYQDTKVDHNFVAKAGTIDQLEKGVKDLGKFIAENAGTGIAIAVAVGMIAYAWKGTK